MPKNDRLKRFFRLRKETSELLEGAIVREQDGYPSDFELITLDMLKYPWANGGKATRWARGSVINEPQWWEEVYPLSSMFLDAKEIARLEKSLGIKLIIVEEYK